MEASGSRVESAFLLKFVLLASGIITAALGFLALLGWALGLPLLASFGADLVPMAPSTAVLFLLYGVVICLRARTPLSRCAFWVSVTAGCLIALVVLLLFVLGCLNIHWRVEHLSANITATVQGVPIGHMSPVTAACFLLATLSFLTSLPPSATRPWRTALALGSAGVLLGTCYIFLLAYLFGTPLLYSGRLIPPSLSTILAFTMLCLALVTLASRRAWLFGGSPANSSRTVFHFIMIFVALAVGIVTSGYLYYRNQERHYRITVEQQLSAIAELKVDGLVRWRDERRADAAVFFKNPSFSALMRRFLEKPENADAQCQLLDWLGKYSGTEDYSQVFLLDAQGARRLSVPTDLNPVCSDTERVAAEVLRSGRIAFEDFNRHSNDQNIYLAVIVPILDESDANRPLGAVGLRIDPVAYLYPFIKRWPTPSPTAETLLLRRDGNEVLYLNDLRHQSNAALALRIPLKRTEVPAVRAVLGQTGILQGQDYRGVTVIAAARAVPDSPWVLIAKMDAAEMYAPLRERLWQMVVMVGILLFGAGAGVGLVWRQQRVQFYREQAEATEALRESEARYRALTQSANDAIVTANRAGMIVGWNRGAEKIFGYSETEILGQPLDLIMPRPFRDADGSGLKWAQAGGQPHLIGKTVELTGLRKDGSEFPLEQSLAQWEISDEGFFTGIIRDITERKHVEEEKARLLAIIEESPDFIGVADMQGNLQYHNRAAKKMVGLPEEADLAHMKISDMHPGWAAKLIEEEGISTVLRQGLWTSENVLLHRNGSEIPVSQVLVLHRDSSGEPKFISTIMRDITERKRTEKALKAANEGLQDALNDLKTAQEQTVQQERLHAIGTMASGIAHDFNNSLTAILGYSELLLHWPEVLDDKEQTRTYIEMMNTAAQDAGKVVNRLREFYRYRDETEVFALVDINQLVNEAVALTQPKWKAEAEAHGISVDVQTDLSSVPPVAANAANLREMLTNLIFNAVDAMPRGGTITIRTRCDDGHNVIEVADTGTGMTEEVRRRCLEPFFSTKGEHGTGLGLSMVYGIVQRHEGMIDIQSEIGKGANFIISLPHRTAKPQVPEHEEHPASPVHALRVLVVDDEPMVRKIIGEYLKVDGHVVEIADNGRAGLEKFRSGQFDLVLVDRAMPDMSGDQVASAIKSASPTTPVVMLTGFGAMMDAADEKPAAVDLVLAKPITIAGLRLALAKITTLCTQDAVVPQDVLATDTALLR